MTTSTAAHRHSLDAITGYRIIRTDWTDGSVRRELIVEVAGATNYANALEVARKVRREATATQYGLVDNVYECGCDSISF